MTEAPAAPPTPRPDGGVPALRPEAVAEQVPGYKRAWRWWLVKAGRIAIKQNKVFAFLAYHLGLRWVGLWFRWTKQDRLDRAPRPVGASGWRERTHPVATDPRVARRPF